MAKQTSARGRSARSEVVQSHGVTCAAWHVPVTTDALAGAGGRPCIVMGHGFGGTRDTGLLAYARSFADAGVDAFVFDYRGFGDSEGTPRQDVSVRRQRQDYHAAVAAARHLPGVDPERIALWGTSCSGGHAIAVAARDERVAAVVALTPAVDGLAQLAQVARYAGIGQLARLTGHGLRDPARGLTNRAPHHVPIVAGRPGSAAMLSSPGAEVGYTAVAGPTWRNEACARAALMAGYKTAIVTGRSAAPSRLRASRTSRETRSDSSALDEPELRRVTVLLLDEGGCDASTDRVLAHTSPSSIPGV